jgi:hypothetical protein
VVVAPAASAAFVPLALLAEEDLNISDRTKSAREAILPPGCQDVKGWWWAIELQGKT